MRTDVRRLSDDGDVFQERLGNGCTHGGHIAFAHESIELLRQRALAMKFEHGRIARRRTVERKLLAHVLLHRIGLGLRFARYDEDG